MSLVWLLALALAGVAALAALAAFTYRDATEVELENPTRWAVIVFLVPLYGFVVYLLARSERFYDPETDPYAGGGYNVHPSRADDVGPDDE